MTILPTFRTTVEEIETRAQATMVFADFINTFSRKELMRAAERYVEHRAPNGSVYSFRNAEGGLMGLVIGMIVANSVGLFENPGEGIWLNARLMEHYEFTAESIPPRMLVREAVALRVRLGSVLADLERELSTSHPHMVREVGEAARGLATPEEAYMMSGEAADEVIRRATH